MLSSRPLTLMGDNGSTFLSLTSTTSKSIYPSKGIMAAGHTSRLRPGDTSLGKPDCGPNITGTSAGTIHGDTAHTTHLTDNVTLVFRKAGDLSLSPAWHKPVEPAGPSGQDTLQGSSVQALESTYSISICQMRIDGPGLARE